MKYLVTSALPYANGKLHVGHVAGAYLPADIFVRYLRLHHEDVIYICGTDEHGTPISITADKEGISPREVVDRYHASIKAAFAALGIEFDNFSGTAREGHHQISQEFFSALYEQGHVVPKVTRQFYCEQDRRFLPDRYVEGTCPRCQASGARGDQCDSCGQIYETTALLEPRCKICGNQPVIRETRHWFLQLNDFREQLRAWISHKDYWKENVRNFMLNLLEQGLVERPITRDLSWGIPVPLAEAEDKVLYVWFEAPIGYISSTMEWAQRIGEPQRWKDYWLDPETRLIHFIGKDNIIFHALIWPAMLMGQRQRYCLPHDIPANEFMNLEGQKISTSRNWAVWVDEFVEAFRPEYLRYYLAANAPEKGDSDFSYKDFQLKINGELNNVLGNLANRVFAFASRNFEGVIPPTPLSETSQSLLREAEEILRQIDAGYREYQVKKNCKLGLDLARLGNRYFDERKPWAMIQTDRLQVQETLFICAQLLRLISVALNPILPQSMNELRRMLGLPKLEDWESLESEHTFRLQDTHPLFSQIEDKQIEQEIAKLQQRAAVSDGEEQGCEPLKEQISYDDFARLDIRIAKVLAAEPVPKTDKLLRLKVDIGCEQRELVAGIAEHYTAEDIIGREVAMLVNLAPRAIRGIQSHGMILAVNTADKISLLVPEQECGAGAVIR